MREPRTVLLVRHGESEGNAGLPTHDPASARLTPLGEAQAEAIARLVHEPPRLIVVSPYERARRTSLPLRARHPGVPVEEWPVQEFTYLAPGAYQGTTVRQRRPDRDAYWETADPTAVLGEGAESFAAFHARVHAVRARLETAGEDRIVLFSHKKFLHALLWSWREGAPAADAGAMRRFRAFDRSAKFPNGAMLEVTLAADGAREGVLVPAPLERGVT